LEAEIIPLSDNEPAGALLLNFSVSRKVRNKFLSFLNYSISGIIMAAQMDLDRNVNFNSPPGYLSRNAE
jgi:hypothetical protein